MMNINADGKGKYLFFDNVMMDQCNLKCSYCRSDLIPLGKKDIPKLKNSFRRGTKIVGECSDVAIIKLSGYGEFTLLPGFSDFIEELYQEDRERPIQLITNGSLLSERMIRRLSAVPTLNICVSLDGHTHGMNILRTPNERVLRKILRNVGLIIENNIPLEINSVLTTKNTGNYDQFLDYIGSLGGNVICFPFPVRPFGHSNNEELLPRMYDIKLFNENVVNRYGKYTTNLPPKPYLERMISFMRSGEKNWLCYTAYINIGVNSDGSLLSCACGVSETLGNIFENPTYAFENKRKITPRTRWKECDGCFNHYEVLNLYFDGTISKEDLRRIPSLGYEGVLDSLEHIKSRV